MGERTLRLDFGEFYEREFGHTARSLRPLVGASAEDVAQEAFLVALRQWSMVSELDVPIAWVGKVARRLAWRASGRERARAVVEQRALGSASPGDRDLDLIAALVDLPDRHEAAVWLHHIEDRPVAEVADHLGCSIAATKVLLMRARQRLARRLLAVDGRWVSEQVWTRTTIARRITSTSRAAHVEPILDDDLGGVGGRWELSISGGVYRLGRDDGLRLDHGRFNIAGTTATIDPTDGEGMSTFRLVVDSDRLRIDRVSTTLPPTRGVPDRVWLDLFLESGPMRYVGRAAP